MEKKRDITHPKRGEIHIVRLDPTLGSEIRKTRPALIVQNDILNRNSPITIVAPITSKFDDELYPTEVLIAAPEGGLRVDSVVSLNQIRAIDKQRLIKCIGKVSPETMIRVNRAMMITQGLIEV